MADMAATFYQGMGGDRSLSRKPLDRRPDLALGDYRQRNFLGRFTHGFFV
ncbi:MAG: hypothetical protein ACREB8_09705 [Pseudolabrys sp.]